MGFLRRHPVITALGVLLVLVLGVLFATAVAVWQAAHTDDARRIDHADVILVLGAAQYSGRPSPVFAGRLEQAKLLFEQGRAGAIVVLGGKRPGDITTEAQAGRDYLVAEGLPSADVFAEPRGNTTFESLEAAAGFMRGMDLHSAFLVSDPWHNLRIKRMAGDLGIQAYASATWHSAARSTATRLAGYVRETFAYLYYRVFGR
ncbi:MAG: YdcF family protein [Actinomycetota bacterium]|nr:YdcF family protein [Actinomycetota bacterium]